MVISNSDVLKRGPLREPRRGLLSVPDLEIKDWKKIQKFLETELAEKIDLIKLEIGDAFVATWYRLFRTAGLAFSSDLSCDFHERSMFGQGIPTKVTLEFSVAQELRGPRRDLSQNQFLPPLSTNGAPVP